MKPVARTLFIIIALSALIGVGLYANGYPPERDVTVAWKQTGFTVITWPFFFAVMASLLGLPMLWMKRNMLNVSPSKARNAVTLSIVVGPIFMLLTHILVAMEIMSLISDPTGDVLVLIATAVMFGLMGNYMSIIPYKSMIGLKTQWTLAHPMIWTKTHRFLGKYVLLVALIVTPLAALIDRENALMALIIAYLSAYLAGIVYARMIGRDRLLSRVD